jgi:predicted  nucleic acid-binding Zn-ribbon protein
MSEQQSDQKNLIERVTRATGEVAGHAVVTASRDRAQKAASAAKAQLPATREDVAKLQEQLDRVEQAVAALSEQLEAAKPRRRTTSSAGSAKTES